MRAGEGNRLKYLKRGWNRKEGRGNKYLKGRGQAGSRGGCLKRGGGGWNPLELCKKRFMPQNGQVAALRCSPIWKKMRKDFKTSEFKLKFI